jgi:hypothetical protein
MFRIGLNIIYSNSNFYRVQTDIYILKVDVGHNQAIMNNNMVQHEQKRTSRYYSIDNKAYFI